MFFIEPRCADIPEPHKNPSPKAKICPKTGISHSRPISQHHRKYVCVQAKGGSVSKLSNWPKNEESEPGFGAAERKATSTGTSRLSPQKGVTPNTQGLCSSAGRVFPAPPSYSKAPQLQENHGIIILGYPHQPVSCRKFCVHGRENSTGHRPPKNPNSLWIKMKSNPKCIQRLGNVTAPIFPCSVRHTPTPCPYLQMSR